MSLNKRNLDRLPKGPKAQKSWFAKLFGGRGRSVRSDIGTSQDSRTAGWIGSHGSRSSYEPSSVSTNSSRQASESYFNHRPTRHEYYPRPSVAAPLLPLGPPSPKSGLHPTPPQRPTRPPVTKAPPPPPLVTHNSAQGLDALKRSALALRNITLIGNLKRRPEDSRDTLGVIDGTTVIPATRLSPEQTAHLQNILRGSAGNIRDIVFRYEGESRGMQLTDPCGGKVTAVLNFKIRWYAAPRVILSIRAVELKEVGTSRAIPPSKGLSTATARRPSASNPALTVTKRPAALVDPLTPQIRAWRVSASIKQHGTPMKNWHGTLKSLQVHRGTKRATDTLQEALKGYTIYYRYSPELANLSKERTDVLLECSLTWDDKEKKVFAERIRPIRT